MYPEFLLSWQNNTLVKQFNNFSKAIAFTRQYDTKSESERQMLFRVTIKFITLIVLIAMFDSLIDLFLALIDLAINLLHLPIEAVEYMLELLLVFCFNINHQQSETIIVNATLVLALFLTYRLLLNIPQWYIRGKRNSRAAYLRYLRRKSSCWKAMSLSYKIKWYLSHCLGTASIVLLFS